jgi:uncharacterized protein YmfQ (DUF2313 family)
MPNVDLIGFGGDEVFARAVLPGLVDLRGRGFNATRAVEFAPAPPLRGRSYDATRARGGLTGNTSLHGRARDAIRGTGQLIVLPSKYLPAFQALLPPGTAWTHDADADLTQLLDGMALESARVDARAAQLMREMDPRTASELLPEWEAFAGVPGQGNAAVVGKLAARGRQDAPFFIALAASVGKTVTIQPTIPFVAGSRAGDPLTQGRWIFTCTFLVSSGGTDDVLEQTVRAAAPLHIRIFFQYP